MFDTCVFCNESSVFAQLQKAIYNNVYIYFGYTTNSAPFFIGKTTLRTAKKIFVKTFFLFTFFKTKDDLQKTKNKMRTNYTTPTTTYKFTMC